MCWNPGAVHREVHWHVQPAGASQLRTHVIAFGESYIFHATLVFSPLAYRIALTLFEVAAPARESFLFPGGSWTPDTILEEVDVSKWTDSLRLLVFQFRPVVVHVTST